MKNFVLAILLLFYTGQLFAQRVSPREIVKKSLLKTTGGKNFDSFKLVTTFDRRGTMSAEPSGRNQMLDLIESMISAAPDSVRGQMEAEMKRANERFRRELLAMYEGLKDVSFADLRLKKITNIRTGVMGSPDTTRTVIDLANGRLAEIIFNNPVLMLQYIAADSVELHYTGATTIENEDQHIVQAKIAGAWIEVMIGKESRLLSRIVIPRVDTDPLIGKGPEHYQDIRIFKNYSETAGLLLPSGFEELNTRFGQTVRHNLAWSNINESFSDSTFVREPTWEEKAAFKFKDIGERLFIMELTGRSFGDGRSLVRESDGSIDLFTGFIYNEIIIGKMRRALAEKFPGKNIRNIFGVEAISWIQALSDLFDADTELYYPKGLGFLSEGQLRKNNSKEDSTWRVRHSGGVLQPFETGFEKEGCRAFMLNTNLNADYEQWQVCYYLSREKVVYLNGYLGMPEKEAKLAPWEKRLYELITREALAVEKVICTNGLVRNAPLEMSYEALRQRARAQ